LNGTILKHIQSGPFGDPPHGLKDYEIMSAVNCYIACIVIILNGGVGVIPLAEVLVRFVGNRKNDGIEVFFRYGINSHSAIGLN
jgi:hypothetical protein